MCLSERPLGRQYYTLPTFTQMRRQVIATGFEPLSYRELRDYVARVDRQTRIAVALPNGPQAARHPTRSAELVKLQISRE